MTLRANTGTVDILVDRCGRPATRYTARVGRETLMRKDGHPRRFNTRVAALRAAQAELDNRLAAESASN